MKLKKVVIMAGGTGGHVFPALAVAKTLRERGVDVHWLGTAKGIEAREVPLASFPLHLISIHGLRGKDWKTVFAAPFRLGKAIVQARQLIKKIQPDVVLGFGGFVSGPGGIAAALLRIPLVIHEQNARAGLTNRYLAKMATKVLEAFPGTFSPNKKVIWVGNPVRQEMTVLAHPLERLKNRTGPLHLLVLGGSLGAAAINEIMPRVLAQLPVSERPLIRHQSGEKGYGETVKAYESKQVTADIMPFIANMAEVYEWADVVIARAGASTIAELCTVGIGALLVPYPFAVDDHQTDNALYLVNHGAATLIQQRDLNEKKVLNWLINLSNSAEKRLLMAQSAFNLRKIDACEKVMTICEEICP